MRPSLKRHVLAVLREVIGEKQPGFAGLIGCSVPTVQSIETGRLPLSEKLAERVSHETGVDVGWLLGNNRRKGPTDRQGQPYTKQTFERTRAESNRPKDSRSDAIHAGLVLEQLWQKVAAVVIGALKAQQVNLAAYLLNSAMDEVMTRFGIKWGDPANPLTNKLLEPDELSAAVERQIKEILGARRKQRKPAATKEVRLVIDSKGQAYRP